MLSKLILFTLSMAILIVAVAAGYFIAISLPQQKRDELRLKEQQIQIQKSQVERKQKISKQCANDAKQEARDLLKAKIELGDSQYKAGYDKGLFLKDDYDSRFERCMKAEGY